MYYLSGMQFSMDSSGRSIVLSKSLCSEDVLGIVNATQGYIGYLRGKTGGTVISPNIIGLDPACPYAAGDVLEVLYDEESYSDRNFNESFGLSVAGGLDTRNLAIVGVGTGQAVSQANGTLLITSGTTANKETIIRSKIPFNNDLRADFYHKRSQAIANNRAYYGLADIIGEGLAITVSSATAAAVTIPASNKYYAKFKEMLAISSTGLTGMKMFIGATDNVVGAIPGQYVIASATITASAVTINFTVSGFTGSQSGTCCLWGWNYILSYVDSTGSTAVLFDCCRNGWPSTLGFVSLTSGTQTTLDYYSFTRANDQVGFSRNLLTSMVNPTFLASRNECIPDSDADLYAIVVVRNGATNPASTTTFTINGIRVKETKVQPVSISSINSPASEIGLHGLPVTQVAKDRTISSISAGTALIGDVGVQPRAVTGGFASVNRLLSSAATTNATSAKGSAGRVYKIRGNSARASVCYLKLYNKASAPTVGTDIPILTLAIKASDVFDIDFGSIGYYFSTGIAYAITGAAADADTTAIASGDILGLNMIYA